MTQGWVTTALREIAKTQYGLSEGMNDAGLGFKTFRMGEVQGGRLIDTGRMKRAAISEAEFAKYSLRRGDLLFNRTNSFELVGKTGIFDLDGEYCFASYLVRLTVNRERVIPEFLNYFMNSAAFQASVKAKASRSINQANINATILANETVRMPESLEEQRRIVAILEEAFEGIATAGTNAERNLRNASELFQSFLEQEFSRLGDSVQSQPLEALTEVGSPITYGVVKPGGEGAVPFVRGGDIAQGRVLIEQLRTIDATVSGQYRRTLLRGGELLISLVGQPGQVAVAPEALKGANIARQVGLIRLDDQIDAEYVRYYLQSPVGQRALGAKQSGSVQQVINLGELREVLVPIPQLGAQRDLVRKLNAFSISVERLRHLAQAKLAALSELKKSLLQQAFAGALTGDSTNMQVDEVA